MTKTIDTVLTDCGKRRRRSKVLDSLASLKREQKIVIEHSGKKTRFPLWLAIQRKRLKKPFCYARLRGEEERYEVWFEADYKAGGQLPSEPPRCACDLDLIDWDAKQLNTLDQKDIIGMLGGYRFAPKRGSSGGLLAKAAVKAGWQASEAERWIAKLLKNSSLLGRLSPKEKQLLRAFLPLLAQCNEAWIFNRIYERLKDGRTVEIRLSRRLKGLLVTVLKSQNIGYILEMVEQGKPALYRVSPRTLQA